jgi:hypothetical protein
MPKRDYKKKKPKLRKLMKKHNQSKAITHDPAPVQSQTQFTYETQAPCKQPPCKLSGPQNVANCFGDPDSKLLAIAKRRNFNDVCPAYTTQYSFPFDNPDYYYYRFKVAGPKYAPQLLIPTIYEQTYALNQSSYIYQGA